MKYLLLIVLLVAVIITSGCVQPGPAKKVTSCDEKYRCNGICYPEVGTCCGGIWYPVDNNNIRMCCGGKMVPYGKDTCCGGIFYTTPPYGTCCGGIFYTTPPYGTCCGGKWYVEGTPGECCPKTIYDDYGLPRYFTNGVEYPSWKNYAQVWINTDTQHCCAGKVAPGGLWTGNPPELSKVRSILKKEKITIEDRVALVVNQWSDCGEDACYDQKTQSCCPVAPAKYNVETTYKIQPGKASCCVDTPKIKGVDGNMYDCDPTSGSIFNPGWEIPKNCRANHDGSISCGPAWL